MPRSLQYVAAGSGCDQNCLAVVKCLFRVDFNALQGDFEPVERAVHEHGQHCRFAVSDKSGLVAFYGMNQLPVGAGDKLRKLVETCQHVGIRPSRARPKFLDDEPVLEVPLRSARKGKMAVQKLYVFVWCSSFNRPHAVRRRVPRKQPPNCIDWGVCPSNKRPNPQVSSMLAETTVPYAISGNELHARKGFEHLFRVGFEPSLPVAGVKTRGRGTHASACAFANLVNSFAARSHVRRRDKLDSRVGRAGALGHD